MQNGLILWCNRLIKIGFYLLFALVPLLLTPWNYELFEYNKMMAVYAVTAIVGAAWIVKSLAQKEFRIARTPLDIPIVIFLGSQFVSTLFSIDPHVSWLGYYSRFNGGMWSVISYVLLYYAFLSNLHAFSSSTEDLRFTKYDLRKINQKLINHKSYFINQLLKVSLISATLIAIYGVLERLGIDKTIWVQDVQNRVFSTLGQPNWLAAYLVALLPLTLALNSWGLTLSVLFFIVLLFTRSRSGLVGFAVADVVLWGMVLQRSGLGFLQGHSLRNFTRSPLAKNQGVTFLALHAVFALIVFLNGTGAEKVDKWVTLRGLQSLIQNQGLALNKADGAPASPEAVTGPALEVGGTESATIRKYVWQGAVSAWNSSWKTRLIGTGTETFAFAFYEYRPLGHNRTSEWDFLYNKAHNEYLNYLATTGALGLGSYLLFVGSFIIWFFKSYHVSRITYQGKKNLTPDTLTHDTFVAALFSGWLSILVTNFFGFSVVTQQLFLFLFPALIFSRFTIYDLRFTIRLPSWIIWVPVIGGLYVFIKVGSFWYADTLYAKGYRLLRGGLYGQAIPALTAAIGINPKEPLYHDEIASGYATVAVAAFEGNNATQAAQLAALAIEESGRAITTSPRNVNFWKTRTKVYYTLSALDPTFNAKAVEALRAAIPLSPNDPKIYYNLAILVGRDGESDKAIEYLLKAKDLKPNYRDAYYALWVFYTEAKNTREARAVLEEYVTNVDPNDKDFLERLK